MIKKLKLKKIIREINIPDKIDIKELSNRMAIQASSIIKHLLGMGVVASINHTLDADTAEYLVKEFGNVPIREKKPDLSIQKLPNKRKQQSKTKISNCDYYGTCRSWKNFIAGCFKKNKCCGLRNMGV